MSTQQENKEEKNKKKRRVGIIATAIALVAIVVVFLVTNLLKTPPPPDSFEYAEKHLPQELSQEPSPSAKEVQREELPPDPSEYFAKRLSQEPSPSAKEVQKKVLKETSGEVISPKFIIQWITGPNNYWVEITSTDTEGAIREAEQWFLDQGFPEEDICSGAIPVLIYFGYEVTNELNLGKQPPRVPSFCR